MAISPNEARKLSQSQLDDINTLEIIIDENLYRGIKECNDYRLNDFKVRNIILEKYRMVGWEVSIIPKRHGGNTTLRFLEINNDGN